MSGDTKTTTQTQTSEPWSGAQPALQTSLDSAVDIFNSGSGFQPYTGSTVVPFSSQTMQGADAVQDYAQASMADSPFQPGVDFYKGLYDTGGLSADQQSVRDMWANTASGAELSNFSPAFNDILGRMQEDTRAQTDLSMAGMGRYGSPSHSGTVATRVGDVTAGMLDTEYNRQLQRMDAARSGLANMGQQGINNQISASIQMPAAWEAGLAPSQALMGVGSMYEDLAGRTMADNLRIFNETQQAPLKAVEWLNAIGGGAGSLGGTTVGTVQEPAPNPLLAFGASLLGANSLLNNPIGALLQ